MILKSFAGYQNGITMKVLPVLVLAMFVWFITISWDYEPILVKPSKTVQAWGDFKFSWNFPQKRVIEKTEIKPWTISIGNLLKMPEPQTIQPVSEKLEPIKVHFTFRRYIIDP
jgi:hypothetical protein